MLNDCYINGYIKEFNCIPNQNNLITFQFIGRHPVPRNTFCDKIDQANISKANEKLIKLCKLKCPVNCNQDQYETSYEGMHSSEKSYYYYLRENYLYQ